MDNSNSAATCCALVDNQASSASSSGAATPVKNPPLKNEQVNSIREISSSSRSIDEAKRLVILKAQEFSASVVSASAEIHYPDSSVNAPNSLPAVPYGSFCEDVEINDSVNRSMLTRGQVQNEIKAASGADITTRGRYYPDKTTPRDDLALHLHVSATSREALDRALAIIRERMEGIENSPSVTDTGDMSSSTGVIRNRQPLTECIHLGWEPHRSFGIRREILGPYGKFVKHIQEQASVRLQLKGKGSGYVDYATGKESDEPLFISLSTTLDQKCLEKAKSLLESLLSRVKLNYEEWVNSPIGQAAIATMPSTNSHGSLSNLNPSNSIYSMPNQSASDLDIEAENIKLDAQNGYSPSSSSLYSTGNNLLNANASASSISASTYNPNQIISSSSFSSSSSSLTTDTNLASSSEEILAVRSENQAAIMQVHPVEYMIPQPPPPPQHIASTSEELAIFQQYYYKFYSYFFHRSYHSSNNTENQKPDEGLEGESSSQFCDLLKYFEAYFNGKQHNQADGNELQRENSPLRPIIQGETGGIINGHVTENDGTGTSISSNYVTAEQTQECDEEKEEVNNSYTDKNYIIDGAFINQEAGHKRLNSESLDHEDIEEESEEEENDNIQDSSLESKNKKQSVKKTVVVGKEIKRARVH